MRTHRRSPRILSLFSGIGGLDIGVEAATSGRIVLQCESDPYCQRVLRKGGAPLHPNIRTLTDVPPAEMVVGGFPCQDLSVAGRGAGLAGAKSGLWFEMLRVIRESDVDHVFIENVPGLRKRGLNTVLVGLLQLGYDTVWTLLSAGQVGAPHRRNRMWIYARKPGAPNIAPGDIAHPLPEWERAPRDIEPWEKGVPRVVRRGKTTHRIPRLKALGNAVVPQCARFAIVALSRQMDELQRDADQLAPSPLPDEPPVCGALVGGCYFRTMRIRATSQATPFPTPTAARSGYNHGGAAGRVGPKRHSLDTMASTGEWPSTRWATPTVQDSTNNGGPAQYRRNSLSLNAQAAGPLNPTWVELLMGFPPFYTEVEE